MKTFLKHSAVCSLLLLFFFFSCANKTDSSLKSITVFVPGVVSGSPVYEMLVAGVKRAADEYNAPLPEKERARVTVVEAGTNQAEWPSKLTSVASLGSSVVISSNPSLPEIIEPLSEQFPQQKWIILDSFAKGNPNLATVRYNQREQAFVSGAMAAMVTNSNMQYANGGKKIGFIAAQEYPVMNDILLPAFTAGAQSVDTAVTVDFRLVGNWYDASKASDLARAMYKGGVDVILPIAGGASQGVIAAAKELGFYLTWFDDNGFSKAEGLVVSSAALSQEKNAYEVTRDYLNGNMVFGGAKTLGMRDGYVEFITDDALYIKSVPDSLRAHMDDLIHRIKNGDLQLPMPE